MSAYSQNLRYPIVVQDSDVTRYLDEIRKFPILTEEEEQGLIKDWVEKQDVLAAQQLVTSHLRLVAKIAMQYRGYGLPLSDMISEGTIGLMTAVKKYDSSKGCRLSTYAMWWIKANIQDYILKSWSIVKMGTSAAHKKLFFNLRKIKARLTQSNNGYLPVNTADLIAKELGVSKRDVVEMDQRFSNYENSLNDYTYNESEVEVIDTIAEPSDNQEVLLLEAQEMDYKKQKLYAAIKTLNDREQEVIKERRLKKVPTTLEVLGRRLKVSNERIRQIEERAMQKLQIAAMAV